MNGRQENKKAQLFPEIPMGHGTEVENVEPKEGFVSVLRWQILCHVSLLTGRIKKRRGI